MILRANGVNLRVDTMGDAADPVILLIGGASSSMDWWEDDFCAGLAAGGRFVIRYDSRDTGESTSFPAGAPPYTFPDLVADAVGILDGLGVGSAHVVGISMGGAVAQSMAIEHPSRVESLVLIATSSAGPGVGDLPPMTDEVAAHFAKTEPPDFADPAAVVDFIVANERVLAGPVYFDEARVRALAGRAVARTRDVAASLSNHLRVTGGEPTRSRLAEITVPALVIHGTADGLFPYGHAEALAGELKHARLLPMPGAGHQMPPRELWPVVVPAILRLTSGGWDAQADRLAARSLAAGDATGWFDRLYAAGAAGEVAMPWNRTAAHPLLTEWGVGSAGAGLRAVVVGCGLGADAEYVASLGYETVGFDVAETAIRLARTRHPASTVEYVVADLLALPSRWSGAFDLVVEVHTMQALPDPPRRTAIGNVARLVAPGGTLLVLAFRDDEDTTAAAGPPWPLTRAEIAAFAVDDLSEVRIEAVTGGGAPFWLAELRRPSAGR